MSKGNKKILAIANVIDFKEVEEEKRIKRKQEQMDDDDEKLVQFIIAFILMLLSAQFFFLFIFYNKLTNLHTIFGTKNGSVGSLLATLPLPIDNKRTNETI